MFRPVSLTQTLVLALGALSLALPGTAAEPTSNPATQQATQVATPPAVNSLTIYGGVADVNAYRGTARPAQVGFAVVRQERAIELTEGHNSVRVDDVAALIDPSTVSFSSLTDPLGTHVVEQNFQFDLVSTEKLLARYVDHPVHVEQDHGNAVERFDGTLIASNGALVLRQDDGSVRTLGQYSSVVLPGLPGGLITRPSLLWEVDARAAGTQRVQIAYQTAGLGWWTDYNLTLAPGPGGQCTLEVGAWVSVMNQSGASYPEAGIKLVAGDVNRVAAPSRALPGSPSLAMARAAEAQGFEEKSFFEYHLYTLGRRTSLPDNSTKQIELFPRVAGATCERSLVLASQPSVPVPGGSPFTDRALGLGQSAHVEAWLSFRNSLANHLGIPLPAGRVRVSERDPADGSLEFIGEDRIGHTPRDERLNLKLGEAFDVVGERRQVDFQLNSARKSMAETLEIRLRNHKAMPVRVIVRERLYRWTNWEVVANSVPFDRKDARTVEFPVDVPADAESTLTYTARYTW